eukprot:TRINITY_DN1702_c0_g1_i1.p2 TRINITY_DN1702_c0_g1~~TRINITY_DN1702_c0_g1_i1.p2  ORF type:complete len:145 (+),score=49.42 TRINITY_DN1702_c0_g1_i1:455-889(+)
MMDMEFARVLQVQMDYFSNDSSADKITQVKGEIDAVRQIMVENIEQVLERGEHIELLVDRTSNLQMNSMQFKKSSKSLKRAMWFKNLKLIAVIVFILLIVVYFIVCIACGGMAWKRCTHHGGGGGDSSAAVDSASDSSSQTMTL